ncbi:hypothetical protein GWC77_00565 [Paraburkholderia sp. NMBU_R16]|uniref:hypothetical protein n=1 Tax=Paraburkholderia sp. NMBU_R16 TaxID=2698676 RepID=UPI0015666357|nr:hypothetical protein [Paraburkholderia sp. NMBU_R16]NRO94434.1 hypothetical protein [Paraburkholderia sp. NMBU_R16]
MDALHRSDFRAFPAVGVVPAADAPALAREGAEFAQALAEAPLAGPSLRTLRAPAHSSALDRLEGHLEHIARTRIEVRQLPERIAKAHANGAGTAHIAIAMHRQARLMAAYQLDVLWTAKLVGTATASLKQLIAAS